MAGKAIQLLIASNNPEIQYLLGNALKQKTDTVIVGRARDAAMAVTMAKKLRPDVAVVDSNLPHTKGWKTNLHSRKRGPNTARIISKEVPGIKVILVNDLDSNSLLNRTADVQYQEIYFVRGAVNDVSFGLNEINGASQPTVPVFAGSLTGAVESEEEEVTLTMNDKVIFAGIAVLVIGFGSIATVIFTPIGVGLVLAGGVTFMMGLLLRKAKNGPILGK